jgi:hypothetical protein
MNLNINFDKEIFEGYKAHVKEIYKYSNGQPKRETVTGLDGAGKPNTVEIVSVSVMGMMDFGVAADVWDQFIDSKGQKTNITWQNFTEYTGGECQTDDFFLGEDGVYVSMNKNITGGISLEDSEDLFG